MILTCILPAIIVPLLWVDGIKQTDEVAIMTPIQCVVLEDSDHGVVWIDCIEGYKAIPLVVFPHPVTPGVRWSFKDTCFDIGSSK